MNAKQHARRRSGTVLVSTVFLMVVLLAVLAMAVDIGYINVVKTEAQRSADAAAMSAAWDLIRGSDAFASDPLQVVADARTRADQYSQLNRVGSIAPALALSDTRIGRLTDVRDPTLAMTFGEPATYNAVWVRVRRTDQQNSEVSLFFAKIFGLDSAPMQSYATAAFVNNFSGFRSPSNGTNLEILPFALKKTTWDGLMTDGADDYSWNDETKTISVGGDGVPEVNLFPQNTGASGNCGTVDIGSSSNSTNDIKRQIVDGINKDDFEALGDAGHSLELNESGETYLEGDTGISAGVSSELNSIKGQPRIIPLYAQVAGPGNNALYTIVDFVGVRIMHVDLTGGKNKNKKVVIQPAKIIVSGGIPSNGPQTSQYIYSPVRLINWQPQSDWLQ